MSRGLNPENQALQDSIAAVLADAWPDMLTSTQIAERVGGRKTHWERCHGDEHCRVVWLRGGFDPVHHGGPVPQDSWTRSWWAMDMNPALNRLARDGMATKVKLQSERSVLWAWAGDRDDELINQLEQLWKAST